MGGAEAIAGALTPAGALAVPAGEEEAPNEVEAPAEALATASAEGAPDEDIPAVPVACTALPVGKADTKGAALGEGGVEAVANALTTALSEG